MITVTTTLRNLKSLPCMHMVRKAEELLLYGSGSNQYIFYFPDANLQTDDRYIRELQIGWYHSEDSAEFIETAYEPHFRVDIAGEVERTEKPSEFDQYVDDDLAWDTQVDVTYSISKNVTNQFIQGALRGESLDPLHDWVSKNMSDRFAIEDKPYVDEEEEEIQFVSQI